MAHVGHARISHSADVDGIVMVAEIFNFLIWQSDSGFEILLSTIVEDIPADVNAGVFYQVQDFERLLGHVNSNPIAGNHCDSFHVLETFYDVLSDSGN